MSEGGDSDGSSDRLARRESRIEELETDNERLREEIERAHENIQELRERNRRLQDRVREILGEGSPTYFEIEKSERAIDLKDETEIEKDNRINRRRKRWSYILNIGLLSILGILFIFSNFSGESGFPLKEATVSIWVLFLLFLTMQAEELAVDYKLDEKYRIVDDILEITEENKWATWMIKALIVLVSTIAVYLLWSDIIYIINHLY